MARFSQSRRQGEGQGQRSPPSATGVYSVNPDRGRAEEEVTKCVPARINEWIRQPASAGTRVLPRPPWRLRGYYNDYGVRGNSGALYRVYN